MTDSTSEWVTAEIGDPNEFFLGLMQERAPEQADALRAVAEKYGITFHTEEEEERCYFTANYETKEVTVGLRGAARLMAHSFAYTCAHYGLLRAIQNAAKGTPPPKDYEACIANASLILQWAVAGDVASKGALPELVGLPACPPVELTQAFEESVPADKVAVASEIYANSLVWILFHEVSHIDLEHDACESFESIEQEKDADHSAAAWLLGGDGIEPNDLWKRRIGVATALGWLTAPNVYLGTADSKTHPAAYNRLYQVLERALPEDEEDTWLFVQVILMLHLINQEIDYDEKRCFQSDFKENVNYLIDIVASLEN